MAETEVVEAQTPPDTLGLDEARVVEAALFTAGKPLAVDEIAENTGVPRHKVRKVLARLQKEFAERDTALEVGQAGEKWAMQVKSAYAPATARLAPMEIPQKTLKTLALIAYHQPLLQSDLILKVGVKAYDHVRELYERGLVKRRVHERSFLLSTSEKFPEYFGIPAAEREGIKTYLAEKVGIPLPKDDGKGNKRLDSIPSNAETAEGAGAPFQEKGATEPRAKPAPAETTEGEAPESPDAEVQETAEAPETAEPVQADAEEDAQAPQA